MTTIVQAMTSRQNNFSAAQEALRKFVDRSFGVLLSRWHLLSMPCRFWDTTVMETTMKTGISLHHMIVELCHDDAMTTIMNVEVNP